MNDNNLVLGITVSIVVGILGVVWISTDYSQKRIESFTSRGYTSKTLPGYSHPQWVLEDPNEKGD